MRNVWPKPGPRRRSSAGEFTIMGKFTILSDNEISKQLAFIFLRVICNRWNWNGGCKVTKRHIHFIFTHITTSEDYREQQGSFNALLDQPPKPNKWNVNNVLYVFGAILKLNWNVVPLTQTLPGITSLAALATLVGQLWCAAQPGAESVPLSTLKWFNVCSDGLYRFYTLWWRILFVGVAAERQAGTGRRKVQEEGAWPWAWVTFFKWWFIFMSALSGSLFFSM